MIRNADFSLVHVWIFLLAWNATDYCLKRTNLWMLYNNLAYLGIEKRGGEVRPYHSESLTNLIFPSHDMALGYLKSIWLAILLLLGPVLAKQPNFFFFIWAISGLFLIYFRFFKHITNFTKNAYLKNVHSVYCAGIRTHNLWNMGLLP